MDDCAKIGGLVDKTLELGFSGAALIYADEIVVEDSLAGLCADPRCENYGLSPSCPPHVSGPKGFRRLVRDYSRALVVKLDLSTETLLSPRRNETARFLHENTATLEKAARELGCAKARAFACGSCKKIFCADQPGCAVLARDEDCRFKDSARPSMSGYGLNVSRLMASAGWELPRVVCGTDPGEVPTGNMVGLVLLG